MRELILLFIIIIDKALLKTVAPYISKYIFHTLDTCSPENWDSTFQSTTALLLKVLGNLPADLQASANFKLSDVLGVLFRKGALLPFLKEVMPLIWESIEVHYYYYYSHFNFIIIIIIVGLFLIIFLIKRNRRVRQGTHPR